MGEVVHEGGVARMVVVLHEGGLVHEPHERRILVSSAGEDKEEDPPLDGN